MNRPIGDGAEYHEFQQGFFNATGGWVGKRCEDGDHVVTKMDIERLAEKTMVVSVDHAQFVMFPRCYLCQIEHLRQLGWYHDENCSEHCSCKQIKDEEFEDYIDRPVLTGGDGDADCDFGELHPDETMEDFDDHED